MLRRYKCIFLSHAPHCSFLPNRRRSAILFASLQQHSLDPLITDAAPWLSSGDAHRLASSAPSRLGQGIRFARRLLSQRRPMRLSGAIIRAAHGKSRHQHHLTSVSNTLLQLSWYTCIHVGTPNWLAGGFPKRSDEDGFMLTLSSPHLKHLIDPSNYAQLTFLTSTIQYQYMWCHQPTQGVTRKQQAVRSEWQLWARSSRSFGIPLTWPAEVLSAAPPFRTAGSRSQSLQVFIVMPDSLCR